MNKTYDCAIIGAGPAGLTAALYLLRAGKNVVVFEKMAPGGQIANAPRLDNFPGFSGSGLEFADALIDQVYSAGGDVRFEEITAVEPRVVTCDHDILCSPSTDQILFTVLGDDEYVAKSIILALGAEKRKLGICNEEELVSLGKLSYCAACDGAFFKDQNVAVIGDGNSAAQYALRLADICPSVSMLTLDGKLRCELELQKEIMKKNVVVMDFGAVKQIHYFPKDDQEVELRNKIEIESENHSLIADGIFVAIGQRACNERFSNICTLNKDGFIAETMPGVYAVGDCRHKTYKQAILAAAEGAEAALQIINDLK